MFCDLRISCLWLPACDGLWLDCVVGFGMNEFCGIVSSFAICLLLYNIYIYYYYFDVYYGLILVCVCLICCLTVFVCRFWVILWVFGVIVIWVVFACRWLIGVDII